MHAGRSHGPHGETALAIIDFGAWERRATADGVIDDREVREGMSIMRRLIAKAGTLVTTVEVAMSSFGSPDGLYGQQPVRKWTEAQRRRNHPDNITVLYPEEDGGEAA